ncbi:hypothetical protein SG34_023590 [Thalassomonas viridans]|uniref:Uncharacterized protein n=1 Tax=Thalassomonas viridans TaxID=137584 RepID=A0AAE9Z1H7_9GAMM|nr:hypothetical protein [Thalassomonas viridans]WDE04294.1 hypothetical protein SG34_023590 [Thalassomonas viridans]
MVSDEISRIKLLSERIYQRDASIEEMKEFNLLLEQYRHSTADDLIAAFIREDNSGA